MTAKNDKENRLTCTKDVDLFTDVDFLSSVMCPVVLTPPYRPVNFSPTQ